MKQCALGTVVITVTISGDSCIIVQNTVFSSEFGQESKIEERPRR